MAPRNQALEPFMPNWTPYTQSQELARGHYWVARPRSDGGYWVHLATAEYGKRYNHPDGIGRYAWFFYHDQEGGIDDVLAFIPIEQPIYMP